MLHQFTFSDLMLEELNLFLKDHVVPFLFLYLFQKDLEVSREEGSIPWRLGFTLFKSHKLIFGALNMIKLLTDIFEVWSKVQ
jgi:hypothetical protein